MRQPRGEADQEDRGVAHVTGLDEATILEILQDEDPAPYREWFGSVEEFVDTIARNLGKDSEGNAGLPAT